MKALLLIDDGTTADVISFYLQREGFETLAVQDSQSMLECLHVESPDLIMLDLSSLAGNTLGLCKDIRAQSDVPLIILSESSEENEIIRGMELGADDYIIKPFSPRLMVARIGALLRRTGPLKMEIGLLEIGGLVLDCSRRQLRRDNKLVERLTRQECRLLEILIRNSEHMLPSEILISHVWGPSDGDQLTLKALLARLRRKLASDPLMAVHIKTQRGAGYRLVTTPPVDEGLQPAESTYQPGGRM